MIQLFDHQKLAVDQLKTGSILQGGVGSGKTLTSIFYYYTKECGGVIDEVDGFKEMKDPKDLYIITTAAKRDTLDWESECANFMLSRDRTASINGVQVTVDSWNNIKKYIGVEHAFFIFDEQRVVGYGAWVKSFLKITKKNNWILLSATPGDTWLDYVPVFIANGFYKNITEFKVKHVVYNAFVKYPKVHHYVDEGRLLKLKHYITVTMTYRKPIIRNFEDVIVSYDKAMFDMVKVARWNPYTKLPIKDISEYCGTMRKVVNSDPSRLAAIRDLLVRHRRVIVFYNFNYELDILRQLKEDPDLAVAEYNGHKHEPLPKVESWAYLIQYTSGSEGWNCTEANTIAFYSLNYSYHIMTQAAGRIDRLNTQFAELYYFYIKSESVIDAAISKALKNKEKFNETKWGKAEVF
jgi:hypothetical protein